MEHIDFPECTSKCPKCEKHAWDKVRISGDFYKFTCINDGYWKFVGPDEIVERIS